MRPLQAGDTSKNDPNDALPVAVAALRSKTSRPVMAEDYPAVLNVRAQRHRDLARLRNQVACRLHAVLCDLVPGGHPKSRSAAAQAAKDPGAGLAHQELLTGPRRARRRAPGTWRHLDAQLRGTRTKLAAAVEGLGTTLTQVSGVGPVIAGTITGDIADVSRFPGPTTSPLQRHRPGRGVLSGTAIHRLSLRGNRRVNHAIHMAAINWIRHKHSDGRAGDRA